MVQGDPATRIDSVSIDSRSVQAGQFFVAIRGERFDGHEFVQAALDKGAVGALIDSQAGRSADVERQGVLIRVADTTQALQAIEDADLVAINKLLTELQLPVIYVPPKKATTM